MSFHIHHADKKLSFEGASVQLPPTYTSTWDHRATKPSHYEDMSKDAFDMHSVELKDISLHDLEPGTAPRPGDIASPITGTRWSRRTKAIVASIVIIILLLLICAGVGIVLLVRSRKSSDNIKVDPTFIINGEVETEALAPSSSIEHKLPPTATTTITHLSTAPTPTSTTFTTLLTTISSAIVSSESSSTTATNKTADPPIRPVSSATSSSTEASSNTSAPKSKRANIDVDPTISVHEILHTMAPSVPVSSSSQDRIATITITSIITPTAVTTTETTILPIVTEMFLRTTMVAAPPKTATVFVRMH